MADVWQNRERFPGIRWLRVLRPDESPNAVLILDVHDFQRGNPISEVFVDEFSANFLAGCGLEPAVASAVTESGPLTKIELEFHNSSLHIKNSNEQTIELPIFLTDNWVWAKVAKKQGLVQLFVSSEPTLVYRDGVQPVGYPPIEEEIFGVLDNAAGYGSLLTGSCSFSDATTMPQYEIRALSDRAPTAQPVNWLSPDGKWPLR